MERYSIPSYRSINEVNWNFVPTAEIDKYRWTNTTPIKSYAKMVFILGYGFYIKLFAKESSPVANYTKDYDPVYNDSCLEAFLLFNDEGYINIETNSLGARLQAIGPGRHDRTKIIGNLVKNGIEVKATKDNEGWGVTIDLPLSSLSKIYNQLDINIIKPGFSFKGNFMKTGATPEHYGMWNDTETPIPDFHQPTKFGELIIK